MDIEIVRFIGRRLHPSLVHFPIALFLTAFLFEAAGFFRKNLKLEVGKWNLLLGAIFAIFAAASGLWTEDAFHHPRHYPLVERHEPMGIGMAVLGGALCLWRFLDKGLSSRPRRWIYLLLLALLVLGIGYTAFLGGEIAHDY